ncbi:MAG: ADP-ribosylglycohydrolase family protein [Candidatus Infernicultor aquiphilus]|nr:MAG: ADP-ribosylglycohydrolase family protein [Candidatus Atribacteria bacterium CG17_big_fil_post_rev_8_21_14_2_50_34_11]
MLYKVEALAISLYCSLKFSDHWGRGSLAAINHSGDSDSTESITGAILGTLLGVELIPRPWIQKVEESDRICRSILSPYYSEQSD